jgi:hypothetical protein
VTLGLAAAAALLVNSAARADDGDYGVESAAWNGLRELVGIARGAGLDVETPSDLDLAKLTARDGLLLIYPIRPPPRLDLAAFMADGGRLGLADDFGAGGALLDGFRIVRGPPSHSDPASQLRGSRELLIAKPRLAHALSAGVLALVTNHPQALHHDQLEAIFALGSDGRDAIVLTGAVGNGRLVALADPSTLINNMLEFSGNRVFARNLVRYLAGGGRLFIATPATRFTGRYVGFGASDPLGGLRGALKRIAQIELPAAAVRAITAVLVALLLFAAGSTLPRRSTYRRAMALPAPDANGGFAGIVGYFARPGRNLLVPLMAYRNEFERQLATLRVELREPGQGAEVSVARGMATLPPELALQARTLRLELDGFALSHEQSSSPLRVTPRKFHALVTAGDRILAALESNAP